MTKSEQLETTFQEVITHLPGRHNMSAETIQLLAKNLVQVCKSFMMFTPEKSVLEGMKSIGEQTLFELEPIPARSLDTVIQDKIKQIQEVLGAKGDEYSTPENRYHNFTTGSAITGQHPAIVLQGYMLKHLISVLDIIKKAGEGETIAYSLFSEKTGDLINYLLLLEGLLEHTGQLKHTPNDAV